MVGKAAALPYRRKVGRSLRRRLRILKTLILEKLTSVGRENASDGIVGKAAALPYRGDV
jgi:hypothetical protein